MGESHGRSRKVERRAQGLHPREVVLLAEGVDQEPKKPGRGSRVIGVPHLQLGIRDLIGIKVRMLARPEVGALITRPGQGSCHDQRRGCSQAPSGAPRHGRRRGHRGMNVVERRWHGGSAPHQPEIVINLRVPSQAIWAERRPARQRKVREPWGSGFLRRSAHYRQHQTHTPMLGGEEPNLRRGVGFAEVLFVAFVLDVGSRHEGGHHRGKRRRQT